MKNTFLEPNGENTRNYTGNILVAAGLLVAWLAVAVYGWLGRIDRLAETSPAAAAEQLVWLTKFVGFLFSLGVLAVGASALWIGHRVCRLGEFPPPGLALIRRVRIRTGRTAKVIGWTVQVLGVAVLILGTMGTWTFVKLAQYLLRS